MKRGRDGQAEEYDANPSDPKKLAQQQQLDYMNNMTYAAVAPVAQSAVTSLSDQPASRVVHFRSVTEDITQGDIMSLAVPFGHVDNLLQMRHKNQVPHSTRSNKIRRGISQSSRSHNHMIAD